MTMCFWSSASLRLMIKEDKLCKTNKPTNHPARSQTTAQKEGPVKLLLISSSSSSKVELETVAVSRSSLSIRFKSSSSCDTVAYRRWGFRISVFFPARSPFKQGSVSSVVEGPGDNERLRLCGTEVVLDNRSHSARSISTSARRRSFSCWRQSLVDLLDCGASSKPGNGEISVPAVEGASANIISLGGGGVPRISGGAPSRHYRY